MTTAATPPAPVDDLITVTGLLAQAELRNGEVLAGRFRIESLLGIGGFGFVYRAFDLSLNITVALKLLRPELARRPEAFERFRQEMLLARQVSSPHVVRIHDIAEHGGRWFISMDYVAGESLQQRLDREGKLPLEQATAIARGLLAGLAAAHQRGVIHRDLKPANILLDEGGEAVITDFGVARSLGATGMTQSGVIVGTPEYLSPEQARGDGVDARSDLYAVGLMLYEMLSGRLPFSGGTPAETMMQRIVRAPPALEHEQAGLPRWMYAFSDRLLKVNPAHRFGSANEALLALQARRVPSSPLQRRRISVWIVAALVAVAGVGWLATHPGLFVRETNAPVSSTPRLAVLPLRIPDDDAELRAIARAFEEHTQNWLRGDPARAGVPRGRVRDALTRQTAAIDEAALLRQLPEIATAARATMLLHGTLRRDGKRLVLQMHLWPVDANPGKGIVDASGADAATLFDNYIAVAGTAFVGAGVHAGSPPPLPAASIEPFGEGLLRVDENKASAASAVLATAMRSAPRSAVVASALLRAQEAAGEELPAQATRAAIIAGFAKDPSPGAREIYARALSGDGQGEAAMRVLQQAVKDYPNDATLNLAYADALNDTGSGAQALEILQRYVNQDDQDAHAWFVLGRTAIQQGQADAAVSNYLTRALVLNRLRGDGAAEAETGNALGVGYERLGQLDAASQQYTQAAAIREKLGDGAGLAKSLRNLAIVQAVRGDSKSADATLERVRLLLEKNNDRASLADLYNDRGVVAEEHGAYREALDFYRKALALRQELNVPASIADSLNNVGFSSYSLGDFDNALAFWQQASALYAQVDDRNGALRIDESIGLLDIARGRFASARERLDAALRTAQDHQLTEEAAVAQVYLGQLALLEGRYRDATAAARNGAELFERRADMRGRAEAALLQASIALALGDTAGAERATARLQPEHLNAEQRTMLHLATARRAALAGDHAASGLELDAAASAAGDANSSIGIRVQIERVRAALEHDDVAAAVAQLRMLAGQSVHLGEVPVRLKWLELEVAAALRSGKIADAGARYRESLAILKTTGRWGDAVVLHRLGARALSGSEAAAAKDIADALLAQMLDDAPPQARTALRETLARREREESGATHD